MEVVFLLSFFLPEWIEEVHFARMVVWSTVMPLANSVVMMPCDFDKPQKGKEATTESVKRVSGVLDTKPVHHDSSRVHALQKRLNFVLNCLQTSSECEEPCAVECISVRDVKKLQQWFRSTKRVPVYGAGCFKAAHTLQSKLRRLLQSRKAERFKAAHTLQSKLRRIKAVHTLQSKLRRLLQSRNYTVLWKNSQQELREHELLQAAFKELKFYASIKSSTRMLTKIVRRGDPVYIPPNCICGCPWFGVNGNVCTRCN
jgi:hypothetical protein